MGIVLICKQCPLPLNSTKHMKCYTSFLGDQLVPTPWTFSPRMITWITGASCQQAIASGIIFFSSSFPMMSYGLLFLVSFCYKTRAMNSSIWLIFYFVSFFTYLYHIIAKYSQVHVHRFLLTGPLLGETPCTWGIYCYKNKGNYFETTLRMNTCN